MDMREFINLYAENLFKALERGAYSIDNAKFNCNLCPLLKKCQEETINGNTVPCGEFIQGQITDGEKYIA